MRFPAAPWVVAMLVMSSIMFGLTFKNGTETTESATLPALGAKLTETSVSGISSGAYMAGQFQIAHSKIVTGAAIIAGGPYGCAESFFADMMPGPGITFLNMSKAVNGCMLNAMAIWGVPNPEMLAEKARRLAEEKRIDPISDLVTDHVYLFSGTNDHTVVPAIVDAAARFYEQLGVPPDHLKRVTDIAAGHGFVTEEQGRSCSYTGEPYVVDCDYDQAGAVLSFMYGELKPRATTPGGKLLPFDQRPFLQNLASHGLADDGYVYVPDACTTGTTCRVHIAFHGCAQNYATVGDAFIRTTGFGRWADTNRIIVLFPQTAAANASNPQGCWDWWGYTGRNFLTRDAPQITAVSRMLEHLAAPRTS
ncbi:MAG: poly(3-hydroxybutyrate) depolymerase [Hyphomicrobium sp.]|jgi:poly(3-hydroxybutyrate) depolymerase